MIIQGLSDWLIALVTCLHCACAASISQKKSASTEAANENRLMEHTLTEPYGMPQTDMHDIYKKFTANAFYGVRGKKNIPSNAFYGARGKKTSEEGYDHRSATLSKNAKQSAGNKSRKLLDLLRTNHSEVKNDADRPKPRRSRSVMNMYKRKVVRYEGGKRVDANAFFGVRGKRHQEAQQYEYLPSQYITPNQYGYNEWAGSNQRTDPGLYLREYEYDYDDMYPYGNDISENYRDLDLELIQLAAHLAANKNNRGLLGGSDVHEQSKRGGPPSGFHAVRG